MDGKCVVLGVTGGIAAYKSAELVSRLKREGFTVHVIMTRNATKFIAPLTFETLSGNPVTTDTFRRDKPWEMEHVALAKLADILVIAPATASIIGKVACGIADDMLSTTFMATAAPVLMAPAMNNIMYQSAAVQHNIATLKSRGVHFIGPEHGRLACGDEAIGRMTEAADILPAIHAILGISKTLEGKKVLVTAGPTREPIDPVRDITNRSSGKMGYALANEAARRGAEVILITGPVSIPVPNCVQAVEVSTTMEMLDAAVSHFPACDVAIMAAAPADFRPEVVADQKIKKTTDANSLTLRLTQNPDIAAKLGTMKKPGQVLIAFAAETENMTENSHAKLRKKNADFVVANNVTEPGAGFDVDTNRVTIISADESDVLPLMSKAEVAREIMNRVERLLKR